MPEIGETITENPSNGKYESSLNNVTEKELLWVEKQVQRELSDLQQNIKEDQLKQSFFDRKIDKVEYHMDLVKDYLKACIQKEDFQVNGAVVMAVQIALESKGYDVGKIDGLLTKPSGKLSYTQKAIKDFQRDNKILIDGFPGKETIQKILDVLGDETQPDVIQNTDITPQESQDTDNEVVEDLLNDFQPTERKETKKNVKITLDKNGNVANLQEILDARNLDLPKLKASSVDEVGGFGNPTMDLFKGYGNDFNKKFRHIVSGPRNTSSHPRAFQTMEDVSNYKVKNPDMKSFVMYFDGDNRTLQDLTNWAEWLSNNGIEPVLCTCVGNVSESFNNNIRKLYKQNKDKGYQLIDFAKINDLVEIKDGTGGLLKGVSDYFKSGKYSQSYALMHDMMYKCIEQ